MNKGQDYSSTLIDEIYQSIPSTTFDLVRKRMDLAVRIDKAIKLKGWTQKQFAEAMGKKPSEVSRWLSGTHNFTTDTLWQIEQRLGIQLLATTDTPPNNLEAMQQFISDEVTKAIQKWFMVTT
ncbi:MAG: helix-turn-helix domain-containing protein [Spirosomaceae bacterium]|jgi:transcriptional regulator with XRE-family HTH domain|nr:helix-turn-helix domain-containing protein [Spirosomataceae bacterium]